MADYPQYRRYRTDEPIDERGDFAHSGRDQGQAQAQPADPLAELARLIGQDDPFAGSRPAHRTHATPSAHGYPQEDERAAPDWLRSGGHRDQDGFHGSPLSVRGDSMPHAGAFRDAPMRHDWQEPGAGAADARYAEQDSRYRDGHADASYDSEPPYGGQYYEAEARHGGDRHAGGHAAYDARDAGPDYDPRYLDGHYDQDQGAAQDDYGEPPPPRRRGGLMTVAVVLGVAVIGTAGAFAYRAFVGSGSGKPPVIMADAAPNKVVPSAKSGEAAQPKPIFDRLPEQQGERVVSREEQPVDVREAPRATSPRVVLPGAPGLPQNSAGGMTLPQAGPAVPNAAEPKRVRTVTIRADQPQGVPAAVARNQPPSSAPRQAAPIAAAPVTAVRTTPVAPAPSAAGPLAIAPQSQPADPPRTASLPSPTSRAAALPDGSFMVQLTSQKSEGEAQSSYRALQAKYPGVLGGRQPVIRRADLGDRGVYYRAQVGPFQSAEQANEFCGNLKAAGGQCIVQRN